MDMSGKSALLRVADMAEADRLAIAGGIPGIEPMEAAGLGVARAVQKKFTSAPTVVFCGPGMNGGDGFIVARRAGV
jgi:NAD(P)H-hydrate epimerase